MLNQVTLIGRLGMVPEIRTFPSGDRYASFRMATSETWTDKAGERKEKTEWHNITVTVPFIVNYCEGLKKGEMIYVEGKIETRQYTTKEGETKYATEILVKPISGKIIGVSKRGADEDETDLYEAPAHNVKNPGAKSKEEIADPWADWGNSGYNV